MIIRDLRRRGRLRGNFGLGLERTMGGSQRDVARSAFMRATLCARPGQDRAVHSWCE